MRWPVRSFWIWIRGAQRRDLFLQFNTKGGSLLFENKVQGGISKLDCTLLYGDE